jgi:cell volume regulation protein A
MGQMMPVEFQGFSLEFILIFGSALLVFAVLASRISSFTGVPALLIFLGLGMLAGSEGPGGVPFENYAVAFAVGSVCLAFVLFDGGLRTSWSGVRPILRVGTALSVISTVVTGVVTGLFAHYALGLSLLGGLLLGAIVSSTDAAAVFSILRSKNLSLRGKLKQVLEFEAGSNDPVAIFLTLSILSLLTVESTGVFAIALFFVKQAGLGLLFGYAGAEAIRFLMNRAGIEYEALYGVLMVGLVLMVFSLTAYLGGSGFLAVYITGLMLGRRDYLHKASITRFIDGVAWMSQITIFLVLGLLVFPSNLILVWKEGLLLAVFMMFIARPLSVFVATPGKSLERRARLFVSWIGLRGAAPIILATLPWSLGLPNAEYYFNLVFFIVLISVVAQGISIPWVASKLKVTEPLQEEPALEKAELGQLLPPGYVPIDATMTFEASTKDLRIVDLQLPEGVLLTSIERDGRFIVPQGSTVVEAGDRIRGFAQESTVDELKTIFGRTRKLKTL